MSGSSASNTIALPCDAVYTIAEAARLTGIPPATLRAWERRYDVLKPSRSAGGYRLYDERAIRDLEVMAELVRLGRRPAQAAGELARRRRSAETTSASSPLPIADRADFLAAAARGTPRDLNRLAEAAFAYAPLRSVVQNWLLPTLVDLGDGWAAGQITIAAEHGATHVLMRLLSERLDSASKSTTGPVVLVGLPARARHEIGALAFAALAAEAAVAVRYLGADLPPGEWDEAARRTAAVAAVVAVPMVADVRAAHATCALLAGIDELIVAVGGGAQGSLKPPAVRLGHDLGAGVDRFRQILGPTPDPPGRGRDRS